MHAATAVVVCYESMAKLTFQQDIAIYFLAAVCFTGCRHYPSPAGVPPAGLPQ